MTGVDPQIVDQFRNGAMILAQALRRRAGGELARASGRTDPEEQAALQLTRGQLQEITVLVEEILARWRGTRQALERVVQQLASQEQQLQNALLVPVAQVRDAIEAVYGRAAAA